MGNEFYEMYFKLLSRVADIEDQLVRHLPRMVEHATSEELRNALTEHLQVTTDQRKRVEAILSRAGESSHSERDEAFEKMLEDTMQSVTDITDTSVRDAFIIAAAQAVEHLEMAKYGTLVSWAQALEDKESEQALRMTLDEEKDADALLSRIAEGSYVSAGINSEATSGTTNDRDK